MGGVCRTRTALPALLALLVAAASSAQEISETDIRGGAGAHHEGITRCYNEVTGQPQVQYASQLLPIHPSSPLPRGRGGAPLATDEQLFEGVALFSEQCSPPSRPMGRPSIWSDPDSVGKRIGQLPGRPGHGSRGWLLLRKAIGLRRNFCLISIPSPGQGPAGLPLPPLLAASSASPPSVRYCCQHCLVHVRLDTLIHDNSVLGRLCES